MGCSIVVVENVDKQSPFSLILIGAICIPTNTEFIITMAFTTSLRNKDSAILFVADNHISLKQMKKL